MAATLFGERPGSDRFDRAMMKLNIALCAASTTTTRTTKLRPIRQ